MHETWLFYSIFSTALWGEEYYILKCIFSSLQFGLKYNFSHLENIIFLIIEETSETYIGGADITLNK